MIDIRHLRKEYTNVLATTSTFLLVKMNMKQLRISIESMWKPKM